MAEVVRELWPEIKAGQRRCDCGNIVWIMEQCDCTRTRDATRSLTSPDGKPS